MHPQIKKFLESNKTDGFLLTSPKNVRYLSGYTGSNGQVLITPSNETFFTDGRYIEQSEKEVPSSFDKVIYSDIFAGLTEKISEDKTIKRLLFEPGHLTVSMFEKLKKLTPKVEWVGLKEPSANLRIIKKNDEIKKIKKAIQIHTEARDNLVLDLKPGMKESEIALELEFAMRKLGAEKMSFDCIIASGINSALPHANPGEKELAEGEFLTIDCGAIYKGYCSDETITLSVGKPSEKQKNIYNIVKEAHDLAIDAIKPGVKCAEIDKIARDHIEKAGYGKEFSHSLGHGVGLDVHEYPVFSPKSDATLEPGMVVTIEPGIYIGRWGGVRIEDMVLVTENGHELLTTTDKALRSVG